jgi:uncharacterized membrane protein YfcA
MIVVTILVGLLIGTLVGISGIGGAVMLLPLLIIVLKVPPLIAVGSGAVFAALTKVGAGAVHIKQGTVDLKMALFLAIGSIPGALIGFRGLSVLRSTHGDDIDYILRMLIGVLLVIIPLFFLAQIRLLRSSEDSTSGKSDDESVRSLQTIVIGLVGGVLVGLTSVGSGSVILVALLLTYRREPAQLVGTDIVHAIMLTGLTGALHVAYLDTVDMNLVLLLLAGSIPGALIGAKLSVRIPARLLQTGLLVMLLVTGVYLISY